MKVTYRLRKSTKTYSIELELQYNNRRCAYATGFSVEDPNDFNPNTYFSKNILDYNFKNLLLQDKMIQMQRLIISYTPSYGKDIHLEEKIREIVKGSPSKQKPKNFLHYLDEYVQLKNNEGTKRVYNNTRNKIVSYDPDCTFESMDRKWLINFEAYCARTMKINAYGIHFRNIRTIFNYAIDEEITTLYPFRKFKIKHEETRKRSLTIEQLRELRDYPCEEYQRKYRDMFMLSFYLMGINMGDLLHLKKENIVNGRVEYHRAKTNKLYSIKIEPEAEAIINRYKGVKYLLNPLDHYKDHLEFVRHMNRELKKIGSMERKGRGGKKLREPLNDQLSSYWARHTWATIAARLDIPIETISKCLGHSYGSSVTAIYIKFDDKKIDEANRKVIDEIKR